MRFFGEMFERRVSRGGLAGLRACRGAPSG